jgi:predicted DNA-binding transcriptional regulator YafY
MLMLLQIRGRVTAPELARELEVSVRTVYRDIESLSASGVPIYADRGPAGGYQLLGGYRTRLTGLTPDEAGSLFLAGMPGQAAELGLGEVLAAAQLKLLASLPQELREQASRISERFYLDAPGWFQTQETPPYLTAVAGAVWNQQQLSIHYRRWGGEVTRTIDPLGLVLKGAAWYVVARSEGQYRTYRVSRILHVEPLEASFERPADFDLDRNWHEWEANFQERLHQGEITARVSPMGYEALRWGLSPYAYERAIASASEPDADGWRIVEIPIEAMHIARWDFLRFGAELEVIEPVDLRDQIRESARAMLTLYGGEPTRSDGERAVSAGD